MCTKYQIVTNQSIVMNTSCSQPDPQINLMQQGNRAEMQAQEGN